MNARVKIGLFLFFLASFLLSLAGFGGLWWYLEQPNVAKNVEVGSVRRQVNEKTIEVDDSKKGAIVGEASGEVGASKPGQPEMQPKDIVVELPVPEANLIKEAPKKQVEKKEPPKGFITNWQDVWTEFYTNEVGAEAKYAGKRLRFEGQPVGIRKADDGRYFVALGEDLIVDMGTTRGFRKAMVIFYFDEASKKQLNDVSVKQQIVIEGDFSFYKQAVVAFDNSKIVSMRQAEDNSLESKLFKFIENGPPGAMKEAKKQKAGLVDAKEMIKDFHNNFNHAMAKYKDNGFPDSQPIVQYTGVIQSIVKDNQKRDVRLVFFDADTKTYIWFDFNMEPYRGKLPERVVSGAKVVVIGTVLNAGGSFIMNVKDRMIQLETRNIRLAD